jgi:hypothetical protein
MLTESERQQFASLFRAQVTAAANSGVLADLGQKFHAELIGTFDLLELARAGQGDAILREPPATTTRKAFLPLTWGVKRNPGFNYVLGDVGVLAQFSDAADLVLLGRGVGSLTAVFLPISSTALLIGSTQAAGPVDDEIVNIACSELSRTFFVSATNGDREEAYFARLGKRAAAFDDSVTGDLIRRGLDDQRPKDTGV